MCKNRVERRSWSVEELATCLLTTEILLVVDCTCIDCITYVQRTEGAAKELHLVGSIRWLVIRAYPPKVQMVLTVVNRCLNRYAHSLIS
jgi:hypothetical protein